MSKKQEYTLGRNTGRSTQRSLSHNMRIIEVAISRCGTPTLIDCVVSELDLMLKDGEVKLWHVDYATGNNKSMRQWLREMVRHSGQYVLRTQLYIYKKEVA